MEAAGGAVAAGEAAPEKSGFVHAWLGGSVDQPSSPNDPLFFHHHANIDRLWARRQRLWRGEDRAWLLRAGLGAEEVFDGVAAADTLDIEGRYGVQYDTECDQGSAAEEVQ